MGLAKSDRIDNSKPRPASFIPSQGPAIGLPSPLGSVMSGQQSAGRSKKDMNTPLLLTALVDAFSILVIFLLVQVSNAPNTFEQNDKIKLPTAASVDISQGEYESRVANLVVTPQGYTLDGKSISIAALKDQLKQLKLETGKSVRLVIQADQKSDFDLISPLLSMTAEAGVSKLEFAVEQVEKAL
ncbi:hypothetical protein BH10BDE1_BH10BDE1_34110 [soil metagenome]